jgi:hypothetical protein
MPEFPLLKSQSGQVEWKGGSNTVPYKFVDFVEKLLTCLAMAFQTYIYEPIELGSRK